MVASILSSKTFQKTFMKKIILVIACIIAGLFSYAQTDTLSGKLDSIFQNIDKSQIPTGYLK